MERARIEVKKHGVVLHSRGFGFESSGILNPAIYQDGNRVRVYYRAVAQGNYSTIGYCELEGPLTIHDWLERPLLFPTRDFEHQGLEDPRIVKVDGVFYMLYTGYDGINALGCLATSVDGKNFLKLGIVVPVIQYESFERLAESKTPLGGKYARYNKHSHADKEHQKRVVSIKDVVLFPRKIKDKFWMMLRIKPDIQLVSFYHFAELNAVFWENVLCSIHAHNMLSAHYEHEVSYVGGGCPPIETKEGWLVIYHGVHDTVDGYVYVACATLFDLNNPVLERSRLPYPLFSPDQPFEKFGVVDNVCFPTGTAVFEGSLYIYYGAADTTIACASVSIDALVQELLLNINENTYAL